MTRITLVALLTVSGYLQYRLWLGEGSLPDAGVLAEQVVRQRNANQVLELRISMLHQQIQELRAGDVAVEEIARTELGMIGEGETFVQIVD